MDGDGDGDGWVVGSLSVSGSGSGVCMDGWDVEDGERGGKGRGYGIMGFLGIGLGGIWGGERRKQI